MSFAYALTFFCDAMLYYGGIGCLGLLGACRPDIWRLPLVLLLGCWLSGRLTGRGKPWLRWLPMAVIALCFPLAGNAAGWLTALPMMAYLPLYVYNNRRAPDYDYAADRFRHSLIGMGVALLLAAVFRASSWKRGLPYLFVYFTLSMTLLRLLRHDDRVARSRRFRLINLAGVGLVCGAGFALSQPGVVALLRAGWEWFLDHVVLNLLALVAYGVEMVLYGVSWLLSWIPGLGDGGIGPMPQLTPGAGEQALVPRTAAEVRALPLLLRWALKGAGLALLVLIVFAILRALSRRVARAETASGDEQRESLDAEAPRQRRAPRLRQTPQDGVRRQYRRALALIRARGGVVAPTMNTLQIQQQNAEVVDYDALDALREAYLPVRYGGRAASREDLARARAAYDRLKERKTAR